jgi:hypothetical protein
MAAKAGFLLASCQLRVSGDWVVVYAARTNRSLVSAEYLCPIKKRVGRINTPL